MAYAMLANHILQFDIINVNILDCRGQVIGGNRLCSLTFCILNNESLQITLINVKRENKNDTDRNAESVHIYDGYLVGKAARV